MEKDLFDLRRRAGLLNESSYQRPFDSNAPAPEGFVAPTKADADAARATAQANVAAKRNMRQTDAELGSLLDFLHRALRGIDAADQTSVIPHKDLMMVADAVEALEKYARDKGISLSEFQVPNHTTVPSNKS